MTHPAAHSMVFFLYFGCVSGRPHLELGLIIFGSFLEQFFLSLCPAQIYFLGKMFSYSQGSLKEEIQMCASSPNETVYIGLNSLKYLRVPPWTNVHENLG